MSEQSPYIYPGCMHIHSTFSDGSGTIPEIIEAAHESGVRWLIITDHDTLAGKDYEGWHDDVLVLIGHEVTPVHSHFLALNTDTVINRKQPAQGYINETYQRGGFGVLAHPDDHIEDRTKAIHPWKDWTVDGPDPRDGQMVVLEIWNVMSDWRANKHKRNHADAIAAAHELLHGPTANLLQWWDRLNMEGKPTSGIGGLDAHANRELWQGRREVIFPYEWMMQTVTNYLVLDEALHSDVATARQQVLNALWQGRNYFLNRLDGTAPALPLQARQGNAVYYPGDSLLLSDGSVTLEMDGGDSTTLRLIHNGDVMLTSDNHATVTLDHPGIYRLEGERNGRHWLFTNPLFVE